MRSEIMKRVRGGREEGINCDGREISGEGKWYRRKGISDERKD